jgi:hypothetical protein
MELKLIRETYSKDSTIGKLYINGVSHCFTLEDMVRPKKIKSITAIPSGKYEVVITYSNRFKVQMPLLLNVPNFEGVRIHSGNYSKDTDGCILVGSTKAVDFIGNSKAQYAKLLSILKKAISKEKIYIEIVDSK